MNEEEANKQVAKALDSSRAVTGEATNAQQSISSSPADDKSLIDVAKETADRLEKGIAETKALIERQERIKANELLGGRSQAGHQAPQLTPEEERKALARKALEGTGLKIY